MGQLSHFVNYAPQGQDYSLKRYKGEYERNLAVLERWLEGHDYLLGEYSIADMQAFPWALLPNPCPLRLTDCPERSLARADQESTCGTRGHQPA